jgi:hypothetical protein
LPPEHGWLPTLRIADFEVKSWLFTAQAETRMRKLLDQRLQPTEKPNTLLED